MAKRKSDNISLLDPCSKLLLIMKETPRHFKTLQELTSSVSPRCSRMQLREAKPQTCTPTKHPPRAPATVPRPAGPGTGSRPGSPGVSSDPSLYPQSPWHSGPNPAAGHVQTDSPFSAHTAPRPCCSLTGTTWEFGSDASKHFKERCLRGGPSLEWFPLRHEPRGSWGWESPAGPRGWRRASRTPVPPHRPAQPCAVPAPPSTLLTC